jgi:hypothetical protein
MTKPLTFEEQQIISTVDPEFLKTLQQTHTLAEIVRAFSASDPQAKRLTVRYRRGANDFTSPVSSALHRGYAQKGWTAVAPA